MTLIKISINDNGEHWEKKISLFGICVYHRHDFTKNADKKKTVGFNVMPSDPVDVDDEDYYPEEFKHKTK